MLHLHIKNKTLDNECHDHHVTIMLIMYNHDEDGLDNEDDGDDDEGDDQDAEL